MSGYICHSEEYFMKNFPIILSALSFLFLAGIFYGAHNISVDAISTIGQDGIPQLIDVVRSTDPADDDIRVRAMKRLGELKAKESVDMLVEMLETKRFVSGGMEINNWRLKVEAAKSLAEIGDPRADSYLTEMLRYDVDTTVRRAAAQALGDLGETARTKPVLDVMHNQLEGAKDNGLVQDLSEALGKIGDKASFVYLLRVTQGPWLNSVKDTAQKSIGMLKWDKPSIYESQNATADSSSSSSVSDSTKTNK
jgi:hypothetical protein